MPFATVSWEVSTGDPVRHALIASAVQNALGNFGPSPLLATTAILDTSSQNVEMVRRALDAVASSFPQEFFYTSSNHGSADVQGVYPPWGDLTGAHVLTGSTRNPRVRKATPAAAGPARRRPTGARRPTAPAKRTGTRSGKRAARRTATPGSQQKRSGRRRRTPRRTS